MAGRSFENFALAGLVRVLHRFGSTDPIVQWPRTPPFHGGNTGSNPVRVASFPAWKMARKP